MTMSKKLEIKEQDGQRFVDLRLPGYDALWYMQKGERLYTVGGTGYSIIERRDFEQEDGFIRVKIYLTSGP